ncbi:hypothetical protein QR685DRAFT_551340 [Neurospora intermedia]|uniref:Transposase n=1 Tax=Neurospora intermedia TaxID=5142 RepID=A0ABR3DMB6_NEUIN
MVPRGTAVNHESLLDSRSKWPCTTANGQRRIELEKLNRRKGASPSGQFLRCVPAVLGLSDAAAKRRVYVHVRRHDTTRCALDECGYLPKRSIRRVAPILETEHVRVTVLCLTFRIPDGLVVPVLARCVCWALEPFARMQYDPRRRLWQIALASLFVHGNRARRKFM